MEEKLRADRARVGAGKPFLVAASAETNGLCRANASDGDEVALLSTETPDGIACAERLACLLGDEIGCRARVHVIEGLQVRDGKTFREKGIDSLFRTLETLTADLAPEEVQLNVTGGFKGVVPYLVLFGMFRRMPVSYVYEASDTLITLPPVPLELAWERLVMALPAVLAIAREGAIPLEQWKSLMPRGYWAGPDEFTPLFEFDRGSVGLSGIGRYMHFRHEGKRQNTAVLLSPQARRALDAASAASGPVFERMLSRVRSPLQRQLKQRCVTVGDLKLWRENRDSGVRPAMFYWVAGEQVMVAELFADHAEYDRHKSGGRADYDSAAFSAKTDFAEDTADSLLSELRNDADGQAEQLAALQDEVRSLKIELEEARVENRKLSEAVGTAQAARDKRREEVRQLDVALKRSQQRVHRLNETISRLHGEIVVLEAHFGAGAAEADAALLAEPVEGAA
ncbi:MAG: putative CRISPR-associated protein [Enhydrobacter sp.]|nr:MAG: putative CRISPR-associated protein [Enhydrobacter sp.]